MTDFRTRQITSALSANQTLGGSLKAGSVLQERYSVIGILGVGGMGAVYKARDMRFPNVTKLVAVKEMINLAPDPSLRQMIVRNFEREANLLATLNHPAIPKIYDLINFEDRSYLVMEYIEGKDLEALLNDSQGFLPEQQVLSWAIQLCDVLTYIHSHEPDPIVFRDLKPSNVMIDQHENVRLIDFGIAKGFQAGQKGTMIGTEGYSPPEQYRGEAGPAGDLYALGAAIHHLLTKRDPRIEPPFSFSERPIRKLNPSISPQFEVVINTSLAYNPTDRYRSAATMKDALLAVRNGTAHPATAEVVLRTAMLTNPLSPSERQQSMPIAMPTPPPVPQEAMAAAQPAGAGVIPLWVFKCEDEIRGQPLVSGKYIHVGVYDNNVYTVSRAEGKFVWKYATQGGFAASPVAEGSNIYIGSEDGKLYALTAENGRLVWNYETAGPIRCTARLSQGHVFVGSDDSHLHAINMQTGKRAWRYEAVAPIRTRPAILEKESRVFFGCEAGEFYAVDFSGTMKWRFRAKRAFTSSPALVEGLVVVGSSDYNVYGLEASSGWAVWKTRTNKPVVSSPTVTDKAAYVGSADGNLYAIDLRSGKVLWKFETGDQVASSPAVYKSAVYFGSVDGCVYCVEVGNGKLRWKFKTDGPVISSPMVVDDVVYIGSTDHNLYAFAV
jgi:serine/threonine protein kinase/outer membrane protein assembly factor BamB